MASKEKDSEMDGSSEIGNKEGEYERIFQELQKYIPFLEKMINKLECSTDKSREAQLKKMKSLHDILTSTKKILTIDKLKKCGDVLQKLHEKVEKGNASQQRTANSDTFVEVMKKSEKPADDPTKEDFKNSANEQHVTSSTDGNIIEIIKSLRMVVNKNVSSTTTLSPAHSSENSRDELPTTTCNIQLKYSKMPSDNLEQSRERLKKLMGQHFFSSERNFDSPGESQHKKELLRPLKNEANSNLILDRCGDPHLRESPRMQYNDMWYSSKEDSYMRRNDYKTSFSWPSRHGEGDKYSNFGQNANKPLLSPNAIGANCGTLPSKPMESPTTIGPNFGQNTSNSAPGSSSGCSNFGPNTSKIMLSPNAVRPSFGPNISKPMLSPNSGAQNFGHSTSKPLLSPTAMGPTYGLSSDMSMSSPTSVNNKLQIQNSSGQNNSSPVKRQSSQCVPSINVLQHPPAAGSKPLSDADIEELLEDTSKKVKDNEKKEAPPPQSLRAKLEQEIQQVHKVGVSKGGALRNLVQKDEKLKSPTRCRLDFTKSLHEAMKDKSPIGVNSDKQKSSFLGKKTPSEDSKVVGTKDEKPTDPRKRVSYKPRVEEECLSVKWDKIPTNVNNKESKTCDGSDSQDKLHEDGKKEGTTILSSLSKEELQKIVEQNLSNLPSLPPNTKEILETVSMTSSTAATKPAWHSSSELMSPLSPTEYNHSLPRNTSYNSNFTNSRPILLPTPDLPRTQTRNQIQDPRLCAKDGQMQGMLSHSATNDPRLTPRHLPNENYMFNSYDQFLRHSYNQDSQSFFANQHAKNWPGTPCYGILSNPNDNFPHLNQGFPGHSVPPHEFAQFSGQIPPMHDSFPSQQLPSWQSQHPFRGGTPGNFCPPPPGQQRMEGTHGLNKGPVDPRLSGALSISDARVNSQFRPIQNTNSIGNNPQIRGSGHTGLPNVEGRPGSVFSERDPRRKSIEDSEKYDTANKGNRDRKDFKNSRENNNSRQNRRNSNSWVVKSNANNADNSNNRRKGYDPRRYEANTARKDKTPETKKEKNTDLVSPLNSLYDVPTIAKTGKGYGFQKFRIPKIKHSSQPPPPPSKPSELLESESQVDKVSEDELTKEISKTKSDDDLKQNKTSQKETSENVKPSDLEEEKNSQPRAKDSFTQEWIESLIKVSFEAVEGKKLIEAKLFEKLSESLKGKKLKKIKQILESDSESESDTSESSEKKDCNSDDKDKSIKGDKIVDDDDDDEDDDILTKCNKKSKSRRIIESDDEPTTDSEPKLNKNENSSEIQKSSDNEKKKCKEIKETKSENDKENSSSSEMQNEPVKKYSKRRSALELLQEDIREMFICEGVVTATGHRMCRLLKETRPDMPGDEIAKSLSKDSEEVMSAGEEDSDGSCVMDKKLNKNNDSSKRVNEGREAKRKKAKVKIKGNQKAESENLLVSCSDMDESMVKDKSEKEDNVLDDSCSPVTKPRKKYEKSKWKGYIIEESEDSQDESIIDKEETKTEFHESTPVFTTSSSRKYKSDLKDPGEEHEDKHQERRTRLPRVVLEKTDITKMNTSSKSKPKNCEDSSSDESVEGNSYSLNMSKQKQLQKSGRGRYNNRGRGRGGAKRGRKKRSELERNSEFPVDNENIFPDDSSDASSPPQIIDWSSPNVTSFIFSRNKSPKRRSKFLGIKIDDIVEKLCSKLDSTIKIKNNKNKSLTKRKNGRLYLKLIRNSGIIQKKIKKKKTKWQLGIISQMRKKGSLKSKPVAKTELRTTKHGLKQQKEDKIEPLNIKEVGDCSKVNQVRDNKSDVENDIKQMDKDQENEYNVKLVDKDQENENFDNSNENLDNSNKNLDNSENLQTGDAAPHEKALFDEIPDIPASENLIDKKYFLDGSPKYSCKLCPSQYKNIVTHYRNNHSESEVLISRFSEETAVQAIAEALKNDFEKEDHKDAMHKSEKGRQRAGEFICRICNQIASYPINFYEHISSHTGEYRYRCSKCPVETVTKSSVKAHFYNHHSEVRGIESFNPDVLSQGPSKNARIVVGYLCSSCNFFQLIKQNTEKHILRRHSSENGVKVICINMSKSTVEEKKTCDILESEPKISELESNQFKETSEIVNTELDHDKIINESDPKHENYQESEKKTNDDNVLEHFTEEEKDNLNPTLMDIDDEKSKISLGTNSEVDSDFHGLNECDVQNDDIDKEILESESDMMSAEGNNKTLEVVNEQNDEKKVFDDPVDENVTVSLLPMSSATEEPSKEIDLKAFVSSDELEEDNSEIEKERLRKMEEIAKDLKDIQIKSDDDSITNKLNDKLNTSFLNNSTSENVIETSFPSPALTHEKERGSIESGIDKPTFLDEKRAHEAAEAVNYLLIAEKESGMSEDKFVDSPASKSCSDDNPGRKITRSTAKIDGESDDECSEINFDSYAEDTPESESPSPEMLEIEPIKVLKEIKTGNRVGNIIERLVSNVVTKTEVVDTVETEQTLADSTVQLDSRKDSESSDQLRNIAQPNKIGEEAKELNISEQKVLKSVEPNEGTSKNNANAILRDNTTNPVLIRVGPLEVKRFSEGLLYSCCVRGCIFASVDRMLFALHLENSHKLVRWDGSCKNCKMHSFQIRGQCRLSDAFYHLISYHLVASSDNPLSSINDADGNPDNPLSSINDADSNPDNPSSINDADSNPEIEEIKTEETEMIVKKSLAENTPEATDGENLEVPAPRKFIRLRRLSGDLLSVPKPLEPLVKDDVQNMSLDLVDTAENNLSPMEVSQDVIQEASTTSEDESGPFLRIENVVSLNPEAITEDVQDILKAVEDPNSSKSSDKSDTMDSSSDSSFTASPKNISTTSSLLLNSPKSVVMGSSPKLLKTTPPKELHVTMLRGKLMGSHGTVQMIPLPKSSSITLLPRQQMSPMRLSNVQLSPVKLPSGSNIELSHNSSIPPSLVGLAKITRPVNPKGNITLSKERLGGMWSGKMLSPILPKYVRVEIKDGKIVTQESPMGSKTSPTIVSSKPLAMATKALHPVSLATASVPSVPQVPIVSVPQVPVTSVSQAPVSSLPQFPESSETIDTNMETSASTNSGPFPTSLNTTTLVSSSSRRLLPKNVVTTPPPVPSTPASSSFLSTKVPKKQIPHRPPATASYVKDSKVPAVYEEMIKPAKLRHLYKCMARYCSYSTDNESEYSLHYNEHESKHGLTDTKEKKRKKSTSPLKLSEWQQCIYCFSIHLSLEKMLEHIKMEHGCCVYQCAYCFYRAVSKSYVVLHQNTNHINEHVSVLLCKSQVNLPSPMDFDTPRSHTVIPYICGQGDCGATFYISKNFTQHLEKRHSQLAIYTCHICGSKSFKPERLLAHYKLHSCCFYQCRYCLHGTDTKEEMHHHLCNLHSNQKAHVIIRLSDITEDAGSEEVLESLKILDLEEEMANQDDVLVVPPPDFDPEPEDPRTVDHLESSSSSQLPGCTSVMSNPEECSKSDSSNEGTNMTVASSDHSNATISTVANSDHQYASVLPSKAVTESRNSSSSADGNTREPDIISISNDSILQSKNIDKEKDEIVCLDDDNIAIDIASDSDDNIVQLDSEHDLDTVQHRSYGSNENPNMKQTSQNQSQVLLESVKSNVLPSESTDTCNEMNVLNSDKDSDIECLGEPENIHEADLNEPLITLKHRNPKTLAQIESAVDPLSSTSEITEDEPLVTLKHRDPKKRAAIQMAVDPLSMESTGTEDKCSNDDAKEIDDQQKLSAGLEIGLEEEKDDDGLTGSSLYQCGYASCTFSAENSSLLKDHLLVCDLARDSSSVNCVHCKRQFKLACSLLEHLRTHGTKRFLCGLCDLRAPVPQRVIKHMKQRHRISTTKMEPLNPLKSDPETGMFVVLAKDKGKGVRGGKGKEGNYESRVKVTYLPEEMEVLPRQAIFTRPIRCGTCLFETKVRSNMVRHLELHIEKDIQEAIPPSSAPVNPVPCLDKKEMMFDKMTNLAASSHIAASAKADAPAGSLTLTQELEAKLPKFVPENERYVCGAPGCSYLTCDETMLRHHLRALHFDETAYRCPHCEDTPTLDSGGQVISLERMVAHLKMHDNRLYKCAHCIYHHFHRYVVERHLADKHPEKRPFVNVVREMEAGSYKIDPPVSEPSETASSVTAVTNKTPWQCGLCNFHCATRADVVEHVSDVHGMKSQFKCSLCSYRSSSKNGFDGHFASKHPDQPEVALIHIYRRGDVPQSPQSPAVKGGSVNQESFSIDTTPLWRRDLPRIRHIRGILLEEEGDVPKPDIVHKSSLEEQEEEKKKEDKEKNKVLDKEQEGIFGPYGKPVGGIYFFCPICNKYRTKFKADFKHHLYRELKYHKWVCTHCRLMSCSKNTLQKHSAKVHERDRKPEAIAPLTPNNDIEEWVDKVLETQVAIIKAEQSSLLNSGNKAALPNSASSPQPGPSGLSNKDNTSNIPETTSAAPSNIVKNLRYACKHCPMKCSMIRSLKCHIRQHHLKSNLWSCGYCVFLSNCEENVVKHSEDEHTDLPMKYFQSAKGTELKLTDEFWEREYGLGSSSDMNTSSSSSPVKRKARPSSPDLTSEDSLPSSVGEENQNKCKYCNYCSRSQSELRYHIMRHWVHKPLKCGYCTFEGVREYEIKKHSLRVHPHLEVKIIENPISDKPEIRPLQRTKRSKLDIDSSSDVNELESNTVTTSETEVSESEKEVGQSSDADNTLNTELRIIYRCYYCPQRGTSLFCINQHWEEKHKNLSIGSNGTVRPGLPFRYKQVNLKEFLNGKDSSAGRKPALLCAYCKFRGPLSVLEEHQRMEHPDKPSTANQACFSHYECAKCDFMAFTVNTLKRHCELEHQGEELQYVVKCTKEDTSGLRDRNMESPSPKVPVSVPVVKEKYMCLWCEETCESEEKIQVHHTLCHSHLQLKYSVEKSSIPSPPLSVSTKKYVCPVCSFSSAIRNVVFEHLYTHTKPYKCGYCISTFNTPSEIQYHIFEAHPKQEFRMLHFKDVEKQLAKWRGEIVTRETKGSTGAQKRKHETLDSQSKKLCVARKSTTLSPRMRFHAVARKSTNPLPRQSLKKGVSMESEDTSPPSSRPESPADIQEFSYYGCSPAPVDKNRITAFVKPRSNNRNTNPIMNMNMTTIERFMNMYPVVILKDLKYEKWVSL